MFAGILIILAAVVFMLGYGREATYTYGQTVSGVRGGEGILKKIEVKGEWKTKNNSVYYYVNGKKATGIQKIGTKYYYFDSKGIQRTGWQKTGNSYYFFRISNGRKGYMAVSKSVNGITLGKSGKALLTADNSEKLDALVKATRIVEKATDPVMAKNEKLRKTFDYLLSHYKYRGSPVFNHTAHWETDYALQMFDEGHGSCYAYGAAFAFLANAVGYKECYAISSGGHGWAEVDGKVYDPSWCLVDRKHSYFAVSYDLSGVEGRPGYKNARKYVVKI